MRVEMVAVSRVSRWTMHQGILYKSTLANVHYAGRPVFAGQHSFWFCSSLSWWIWAIFVSITSSIVNRWQGQTLVLLKFILLRNFISALKCSVALNNNIVYKLITSQTISSWGFILKVNHVSNEMKRNNYDLFINVFPFQEFPTWLVQWQLLAVTSFFNWTTFWSSR